MYAEQPLDKKSGRGEYPPAFSSVANVCHRESAFHLGQPVFVTPSHKVENHVTSHPTTSQLPPGAFATLYVRLGQQYDGIVSIHVSAEMSGAVHTARLAVEQLASLPIRVLDSRTATIAEGFVVLAAARAAAAGSGLEQVVRQVNLFATLKTLEHVHRGGRLGEAATLLGSQLNICQF